MTINSDPLPNRTLIEARKSLGLGQRRLAARCQEAGIRQKRQPPDIDSIERAIRRIERGEVQRPRGDFYVPTLCEVLGKTPMELFGEVTTTSTPGSTFTVTSHKFAPVFIGAEDANELVGCGDFSSDTCEWMPTSTSDLAYPTGRCTATVFDFGVLVFHITEKCSFSNVAELAMWRRRTHQAARCWADETTRKRWPTLHGNARYVLSAYWLDEHCWQPDDLGTAVRLLCVPSVLLTRVGDSMDEALMSGAQVAERVQFREGFNPPNLTAFGVDGVSLGYASWSGVAYLPLSPTRSLAPAELVEFETLVQALWCYTETISTIVEEGQDPEMPDAYSWRFLRACHSRLASARPRETNQVRMMRDAILATSRVTSQLTDAQAILCEAALGER